MWPSVLGFRSLCATREAEKKKDADERCWLRANLSALSAEKFQATVHGIHRRFDEVMGRRGK